MGTPQYIRSANYRKTLNGKFQQTRATAIGRPHRQGKSLEWTLTFEAYVAITSQPCYYCRGSLPPTGGLDRIDNTLGYTKENVLPCCTTCNRIRSNTFAVEEMREIGELLITLYAKRQANAA